MQRSAKLAWHGAAEVRAPFALLATAQGECFKLTCCQHVLQNHAIGPSLCGTYLEQRCKGGNGANRGRLGCQKAHQILDALQAAVSHHVWPAMQPQSNTV